MPDETINASIFGLPLCLDRTFFFKERQKICLSLLFKKEFVIKATVKIQQDCCSDHRRYSVIAGGDDIARFTCLDMLLRSFFDLGTD
jgi:hypothetical protein